MLLLIKFDLIFKKHEYKWYMLFSFDICNIKIVFALQKLIIIFYMQVFLIKIEICGFKKLV